jgi:CheY-like chemotaxis protein
VANVLVLEDSPMMRRVLNKMTVTIGYELTASVPTVHEALEVLQNCEIDILVADVGLPEELMPLLRFLHMQCPKIRILLISGTPQEQLIERRKISEHYRFLLKPFTIEQYTTALHELLEAA